MGYDMTYARVIYRNSLEGGYDTADSRGYIKGDLRRFEHDQQDPAHIQVLVEQSGATKEQVEFILAKLFEGVEWEPPWGGMATGEFAGKNEAGKDDFLPCPGEFRPVYNSSTKSIEHVFVGKCPRCEKFRQQAAIR